MQGELSPILLLHESRQCGMSGQTDANQRSRT
jgi:hypothetical protein